MALLLQPQLFLVMFHQEQSLENDGLILILLNYTKLYNLNTKKPEKQQERIFFQKLCMDKKRYTYVPCFFKIKKGELPG